MAATALLTVSLVGCAAGAAPTAAPATSVASDAPSATAGPTSSQTLDATPTSVASAEATPTASATDPSPTNEPATPDANLPLWRTAALTDVRSGETFSVESLAGHLVVIEAMAVWCHNCLAQQKAAGDALYELGDADVIYVSLDIDPSEDAASLTQYADVQGFGWRFVVASREVARSLAEEFGDEVLSPPSVPTITVSPNGEADLHFGHRSSQDLVADLTARLQ